MKIGDYVISLSLVSHGYEIDLLNWKDFISGKVTIEHSECRDYGGNIDVEELSAKIIDLVRNAESKLSNKLMKELRKG